MVLMGKWFIEERTDDCLFIKRPYKIERVEHNRILFTTLD